MFNIDWNLMIEHLLPWHRRKPRFREWIHVLIHPLIQLYAAFLTYRDEVHYRLAITSQIILLQKLLNDKFNQGLPARAVSSQLGLYNGAPTGIYISYPARAIFPLYLWNRVEQRPKTFLYNKWKTGVHYKVGERVVHNGKIYRAVFNSVNNSPNGIIPKWAMENRPLTYLRSKQELDGQYDFEIHIPIACGDVNDIAFAAQVKAQLKEYLLAGKRFELLNY
ncbi:MAG TPA: hypothetical protein VK154_10200 [Chitinophagales bacterium]|nr:hypothetical protein [Chitinophagales bacterium]